MSCALNLIIFFRNMYINNQNMRKVFIRYVKEVHQKYTQKVTVFWSLTLTHILELE